MGQDHLLSLYRHSLLNAPMETCKSPTQQRGHHQPGSLAAIPRGHAVLLGAHTATAFPPLPQDLTPPPVSSTPVYYGLERFGRSEESPSPTPYRPICSMLSPNCPHCVSACSSCSSTGHLQAPSSCNCHTAGLCGHSCPQSPTPHT